ncbi:hypothetical protein ACFW2M_02830 [Streptomyces albidoflavus]
MELTATTVTRAGTVRSVPPPALWGFLLLLAALFVGAYVAGNAVGPVAPGMHAPGTTGDAPSSEKDAPMHHGSGH